MKHSDNFRKALEFTLKWEGGYSNHPNDKGGSTNYGITQRVYDSYCKSKGKESNPVKKITTFEVHDIYWNSYWLSAGCDKLPLKVAIAVFDFAVNSGVSRALRYLTLCNNKLDMYLDQREQYFRAIAKGNNRVFLKGWLNRLVSLKQYLKAI